MCIHMCGDNDAGGDVRIILKDYVAVKARVAYLIRYNLGPLSATTGGGGASLETFTQKPPGHYSSAAAAAPARSGVRVINTSSVPPPREKAPFPPPPHPHPTPLSLSHFQLPRLMYVYTYFSILYVVHCTHVRNTNITQSVCRIFVTYRKRLRYTGSVRKIPGYLFLKKLNSIQRYLLRYTVLRTLCSRGLVLARRCLQRRRSAY